MNHLVIREAKIIDPNNSLHNQVVDILIAEDTIEKIGKNLQVPKNTKELKFENLHVSKGWFDTSVSFGEPGFEERETIANGMRVAAKSGFTGVALQPNSAPVVDNQSQVTFVLDRSMDAAIDLFPIGALTKNSEGADMAELFDMQNAGAIAFGDYNKNITNANVLKIALQYVQDFDGLIITYCQDEKIKGNGVANEGVASTRLGLKGIPALAEELMVARNLFLLEYTGGALHIPTISTAKSVELIKEAKAKGLNVTCSVAVHHLTLTDDLLDEFDTRYKVTPPLRDEANRKALLKGLKTGVIDCITSDHNPIDIEHKKLEFDLAKDGTIGLESAFGALQTVLPLDTIIEKLTSGRSVFRITEDELKEGEFANLTLFNPSKEWVFKSEHIQSKSKNSAFLNQKMKGEVYGIFVNGVLNTNT
jgi:dihydroorotase